MKDTMEAFFMGLKKHFEKRSYRKFYQGPEVEDKNLLTKLYSAWGNTEKRWGRGKNTDMSGNRDAKLPNIHCLVNLNTFKQFMFAIGFEQSESKELNKIFRLCKE